MMLTKLIFSFPSDILDMNRLPCLYIHLSQETHIVIVNESESCHLLVAMVTPMIENEATIVTTIDQHRHVLDHLQIMTGSAEDRQDQRGLQAGVLLLALLDMVREEILHAVVKRMM
jgi:hypothetical protein